jgi:ATPase family associated with various cellular activities (AAA)
LGRVAEELFNSYRNIISNVASIFSEPVENAYQRWILSLIPNPISNNDVSLPFLTTNKYAPITNILIKKIIRILGQPQTIYQHFSSNTYSSKLEVLTYPPEKYDDLENLDCEGEIILSFNNGIAVRKHRDTRENEFYYGVYFPTKNLREYYVNLACKDLAIYQNKTHLVFGECSSKYTLSSFTNTDLTELATTKVNTITKTIGSEKLSILLTGAPGTAKTSWTNAFVKEVISPLGYLTINLDLESLSEFTPPEYVNKVCLVINDGDNLALNRESRTDGFTEKVMSLLDGNQVNCITPFNNTNLKLIIIITANTTQRWDKAALRQGRIDIDYEFTEKAYNE